MFEGISVIKLLLNHWEQPEIRLLSSRDLGALTYIYSILYNGVTMGHPSRVLTFIYTSTHSHTHLEDILNRYIYIHGVSDMYIYILGNT